MKKILSLIAALAVMMTFTVSSAAEEFHPSITVQDVVHVTVEDDADVTVAVELYTETDYTLLVAMGAEEHVYNYFPSNVQFELVNCVGAEAVERLTMCEFMPLHLDGNATADVDITFEVPMDYTSVNGAVGVITTNGEDWYVVPAEVDRELGAITMTFGVDAIAAVNGTHSALAILTY